MFEQVAEQLSLASAAHVTIAAEHRGGSAALLTIGPAPCSFFRDRQTERPAHYEGGIFGLSEGVGTFSVLLEAGEHCFTGGPADPRTATSFSYVVTAEPGEGDQPRLVEEVRTPLGTPAHAAVTFPGKAWSEEWIRGGVEYYRSAGFFAEASSEASAVDAIIAQLEDEWGSLDQVPESIDDQYLLSFDRQRVWNQDLEQDVLDGNGMYVELLSELASISRVNLSVLEAKETWATEDGPILVQASVNGTAREFEAQGFGDWYDIEAAVDAFNEWMSGSGLAYRATSDGQYGFVVVLTASEERKLVNDRAWDFTGDPD